MLKRSLLVLGMVAALSTGANAESIISYVSFDDNSPADPGIELELGGTATIEVWITPTDGVATSVGSGGFSYNGDIDGTTVSVGDSTVSSHAWEAPFQDTNFWFPQDALPMPQIVAFFGGQPVPVEGLLLSTMTVDATGGTGTWNYLTNPTNWKDSNLTDIPLAPGSDNFDVTVIPEPATVALLLIGGLSVLRRRQ